MNKKITLSILQIYYVVSMIIIFFFSRSKLITIYCWYKDITAIYLDILFFYLLEIMLLLLVDGSFYILISCQNLEVRKVNINQFIQYNCYWRDSTLYILYEATGLASFINLSKISHAHVHIYLLNLAQTRHRWIVILLQLRS